VTRRSFASVCLAAPLVNPKRAEREPVDEFGGWAEHTLRPTGRFHLQQWRGGHWLVTPAGHPMTVVGLCHTRLPPPDQRVPEDTTAGRFGGDLPAYMRDTVEWMRAAGFNTFSYGMPDGAEGTMNRLVELNLVPGFINGPQFPDLFDPAWRAQAAGNISRLVPPAVRDSRAIGYVLSNPLLFSPKMERPRIWRDGAVKRQNYLMAVRALPANAPGKQAYIQHLRETYGTFEAYRRKRTAPPGSASFEDLLARDLSAEQEYLKLHPDDSPFYARMWDSLTRFFIREIRRHDPTGIIFSYRFIRVLEWPDPWLEAMLRGVGPHVDAFAAELYGDNPYRAAVDGIGAVTGKPTLILDGMRLREFIYPEEADDQAEAAGYESMYRNLLASPWFLGGAVCEYRRRLSTFAYSPRAGDGRVGVRNANYTERPALLAAYRTLHFAKYGLRLKALSR
jgi:hypothetical protein